MKGLTQSFIDHLRGRLDVVRRDEAREATRLHVLDTVAAVVSGASMPVAAYVEDWLATRSPAGPCSVVGHRAGASVEDATFAHAMLAHADETDDSHEASRSHPGASVVPTALALAERLGSAGSDLMDAVALGYEACALVNWLMWTDQASRQRAHGSPHALGGLWGSAVAAATLHGFSDTQMRSLIGYTAQLSAGIGTWLRDEHHVEKAFAFAGMPAWNAVRAADLVSIGWPGVVDAFDGEPSLFSAFGSRPSTDVLAYAAAQPAVVVETNIKKYCVGSPAQAAVQATEELSASGLAVDDVVSVRCHLPQELAFVVDQRRMTNINVQYLVARTLVDGRCTFAAAHDEEGARIPAVARLLERTRLVPDPEMRPVRQARVEIDLADGSTRTQHSFPVRGSRDDPMTRSEVETKCLDLFSLTLSPDESEQLLATLCAVDDSDFPTRLGSLLRAVPVRRGRVRTGA